tara:strand:+ start:339 stop:647 length:309 start_codon:yes stop_codon:yes gene_type:complete
MFFIIGLTPTHKVVGPLDEETCTHCNNTRHWILSKTSRFISLFFIPIIPLGSKYFKSCPICRNSVELSHEEFKGLETLASLNKRAVEEDMSDAEYQNLRNSI